MNLNIACFSTSHQESKHSLSFRNVFVSSLSSKVKIQTFRNVRYNRYSNWKKQMAPFLCLISFVLYGPDQLLAFWPCHPISKLVSFVLKRLPATWSFALWIASGVIGKVGVNVPSRDLGANKNCIGRSWQQVHWLHVTFWFMVVYNCTYLYVIP